MRATLAIPVRHALLRAQIVDTFHVDSKNILALAYLPELNALAAAGASAAIHIVPLDRTRRFASAADAPLPDTLTGHSQAVTALVLLPDYVLLSAAFDCEMRFWDLHTMSELVAGRKVAAHNAPIVALAHAPERAEVASVAQESVAKVWDVAAPQRSVLRFQIEAAGEITQARLSRPVQGLHVHVHSQEKAGMCSVCSRVHLCRPLSA
jgi:WD40 repeat protein